MPTLKDDVAEARNRADTARRVLETKLDRGQDWSRDDKVLSIDGLDRLVSLIDDIMPHLPDGGAVKAESSGGERWLWSTHIDDHATAYPPIHWLRPTK